MAEIQVLLDFLILMKSSYQNPPQTQLLHIALKLKFELSIVSA